MYKMEPLNRFSSKDLAPSYYGSTCASAALVEGSSADVAALEIRQETVLQRLRDLKLQLDKLQSSKFSSLSPSKTSSTAIGAAAQSSPLKPSVGEKQAIVLKVMASVTDHSRELSSLQIHDLEQTGTVHDLVISANPSRPPYFLILLRRLLKDAGYPVFSVDHLHSSVQHVDESLRRCFSDKPLGDRNKHNLAFTVHWKDVESPNLMVNPLRQTVISGEANIARYVSRLFPLSSSYNYEATGTFSSIAETDNLLDQLAAQAASKNNKERQGALRQLNGRLGKSSWLVSNECGIADVLLWSVLKQGGLNVGAPANVDKWYKKVDAMANLEVNLLNSQNATQSKSSSQATTPIQKKSDSKDSLSSCKAQFVDRNGLEKYLKSLSIPYQVQDHEEVFTVDALMKNVRGMPGLHMKNLFLKDKKKNLYLVSARHNAEVKLNEIGKQLGIKDLRFGDESILYNTLGVKQGCVTAFALLNDRSHQVKFLLDSEAFNDCHPFVNFHPMSNAATLGVAPKDLKKFLNATGHEPTLITLN
ncbi:aminoacyl tRNA synthase complex-interacting multifunctional protein 2-like isoform X4 [Penaeus japonicus]|uniref:aminoacyl tRNA synthase complex-interacting multifunctional protein 2-like isoform X4 n=1 Tax=Penaeus japonicus TaxID=27405 RepID=UPI001C7104B9|nr:aminoacyl tRNA synthase complex-interacting multifunctional protein 2-like isoform X4 [Penaeus japonicus]